MALWRHTGDTWYYKYLFFCASAVIAALVVLMLFLPPRTPRFAPVHVTGAAAVIPVVGQKIVAIDAGSVTVSWYSAANFAVATSTFTIDANTGVYRETPKDAASLAKEKQAFQKQLLAAKAPLQPPLSYTVEPANFSDLIVGMNVSIDSASDPTPSPTNISPLAKRIFIVPQASSSPASSH